MCAACINLSCPLLHKGICCLCNCSCRIYHVIHNYADLAVHIAYYIHNFSYIGRRPPFVYYGKICLKPFGECPCPLNTACIRRYYHSIIPVIFLYIIKQNRRGVQVINRDIEEPLYLSCMEVHAQNPCGTGSRYKVRYELCSYGCPWGNLPVLSCIAVIGYHRCYGMGRGPLQGIHHHQKLHEVFIYRCAGGLDYINLHPPYAFLNLYAYLSVTETLYLSISQGYAEVPAYIRGKGKI